MQNYLFTSESVSEGHPDKMADQISDAILDSILTKDPVARAACETMVSTGFIMLAGEITTSCYVDMPAIAREVVKDIGYDHSEKGFDYHTCSVLTSIDRQSPDIAMGVDSDNKEQGAGDQGIMFGYAVKETPEFMPLSISLSHKLVQELASLRKRGVVDFLRPDSKSQVTVEYVEGQAKRIDSIVLSTQHSPDVTQEEVKAFVVEELIQKVVPRDMVDAQTKFFINPTGRFVVGGPHGDCGLTGRKIIVDTYGGHGAHGGGAFSGKDPSKVDRSAAYAARHIAKNIIAAGFAERCLVQLAYAIGVADPMSILVQHYGTGSVDAEILSKAVRQIWGLKPAEIVSDFDLLKPRYRKSSTYGHFGRSEPEFTWERTDKVEELKDVVSTLSRA
jgi:S-adenosylmethionine synthetase